MTDQSRFASTLSRIAPEPRLNASLVLAGALGLLLFLAWLAPEEVHRNSLWFPAAVHSVSEIFALTVAVLVFAITWHSYRPAQPTNLLLLGCAFLAIALLDLAHTLSYRGMPVFFTPASPEKAINFWLVSRVLLATTLLLISIRPWRPLSSTTPRLLMLGATLAIVALIYVLGLFHTDAWPHTFIDGLGLTPFKIGAEWVIIGLLAIAAVRFWQARRRTLSYDASGLLAAALISILAELCFTAYSNVHELYSLLGHLYKVISYCLIYRFVFVSSVREPYERLAVEIADRQAAEKRIEVMAFHDSLTGLPNLALLQDRTRQALVGMRRDDTHVALLFLDVDSFKLVNDSLGHAQGDRLLRAIGERLLRGLPETATVCRYGSDEFAILLPGLASAEHVAEIPQIILDQLAAPFQIDGQTIAASVSIGIAVAPDDGDNPDNLLRNAEMAMYKAKQAGRKTWRYYNATMNAEVSERLQLLNSLRQAIEQRELVLHYQLQFELGSGRVVGAEALVRWEHPTQGLISPALFIPAAEESGLIVPMGDWIIREACQQAAQWRASGLAIPRVAVNLSPVQLHHHSLTAVVERALSDAGLPAAALELELTESSLIADTEQVLATLANLKALGIKLSIDDFGTGYSSLAYLRRLPVDILKIDQSFVRGMISAADGHAIVEAIIHMARSLGLDTLAEGIEDQLTADELLRLGCHLGQGYLLARPAPPAAIPALLHVGRAERIQSA
ncbi:putative bifunctional diguanylate cyclase/phosphodiesterase [Pseudomonas panipatensis]|uniref:cyclic-guanylate-specific phosphodiesterase n=1 Tax=Pseudomonas panipatensis TaxID=428992 RepID=A0A1G8L4D1_9PSED|nr:EAL domain-containing protein [Pseudomonas panipatensis]SDI50532.1 diguanylate cyclase (GGDEF) domain-containing protein [Pseudomonas panipatensis]SMP72516.1 diguanylate cyclase (GGDEF) domain-containing protein [Pseudomonas panipatensis]